MPKPLSNALLVIFFAILATIAFILWQPRIAALMDNKNIDTAPSLFGSEEAEAPANQEGVLLTSES